MTSFTKTTGVRRKGVKAGSTQGPMRAVTTVITGEPVKKTSKPNYKNPANVVLHGARQRDAVSSFKNVQALDKKYNRGGKVCK